jgi:CDP-diacylglycerol--glycerol-3-phosphate 3-phosphatidyltransferase
MRDLPNILTIGRIAILPVLVILMLINSAVTAWIAVVIYTLACFTDWLDGYIARKYNAYSDLGKFLDPIADKIFVLTVLIALIANGNVSGIWILPVILILTREFLISGLREFLGPQNIQLPVTYLAKWKTTVQMIALGFLIVGRYGYDVLPYSYEIGLLALLVATLMTIVTGVQYMRIGLPHLKSQ